MRNILILFRVSPVVCIVILFFGISNSYANNLFNVNMLIEQAITTHPLVEAARAENQASIENVTAAKFSLYPTPSMSSDYNTLDGVTSRISLRQPLWSGGKLTANINQSILTEKVSSVSIVEQQNTIAKNTIDIWQSHLYSIALQELYVQNLQLLKEFEEMMRRRVEQGVSARIDLDLVMNRILQEINGYKAAQQQQKIAATRLTQMIGKEIYWTYTTKEFSQLLNDVKKNSTSFDDMVFASESSSHNPSVIKQFYEIEAMKQQVKSQRAEFYPMFYTQYEHIYNHKTGNNDGQILFGFSYSSGAGFSNLALSKATQARVASLEQSQEATKRMVMENIQTQYQYFVSAKDQEASLIIAVSGAKTVVDSYRRQFIAGRKSWLEVLNAVREHASYQQQLLQVQTQMLGAFYKLQIELGKMDWQKDSTLTEPVELYDPYEKLKILLKPENIMKKALNETENQKESGNSLIPSLKKLFQKPE